MKGKTRTMKIEEERKREEKEEEEEEEEGGEEESVARLDTFRRWYRQRT